MNGYVIIFILYRLFWRNSISEWDILEKANIFHTFHEAELIIMRYNLGGSIVITLHEAKLGKNKI